MSKKDEKLAKMKPDQVILARRTVDGSFTFKVRVSHIIEQTLLRAFDCPTYKKTTIKVLDDEEYKAQENAEETTNRNDEGESVDEKSENHPMTVDTYSTQASTSKELTSFDTDSLLGSQLSTNGVSPIPTSWIKRGLSKSDRRQINRALANASSCPYHRNTSKALSPTSPLSFNFNASDITQHSVDEEDDMFL